MLKIEDPINLYSPQLIEFPRPDTKLLPPKYEFSFPREQREWISSRDNGRCQMPIIKDGLFAGYLTVDTDVPVQIHHILPEYFWKNFRPEEYADKSYNNPLNGITISSKLHTWLHRDWIKLYHEEYKSQPRNIKKTLSIDAYINLQTASGRPAWISEFDPYLNAIATINTYEYIQTAKTFPFNSNFKYTVLYGYKNLWRTMNAFTTSYYDYLDNKQLVDTHATCTEYS